MEYKAPQLSVMQFHSWSPRKMKTVLKAFLQVLLSKITLSSNNSLCVFVLSLTKPKRLFLNPCLAHFESISALLGLRTTLFSYFTLLYFVAVCNLPKSERGLLHFFTQQTTPTGIYVSLQKHRSSQMLLFALLFVLAWQWSQPNNSYFLKITDINGILKHS